MVEPAVNMKNFGGVDFNWNEVKSAKVLKGKDGKETYFIEFKTGVKAEYPVQDGASMNSRELTMWQSLDYDNETVINGMQGARITGSKKDDHIVAKEINGCTINVANDANDDHVDIIEELRQDRFSKSYIRDLSDDNKIILDDEDTMTNKLTRRKIDGSTTKKETNVKGPGIENRF